MKITLITAFILLTAFSLQGCATYSKGYTPKVETFEAAESSQPQDITFSLSYSQHIGDPGPVTEERIMKKIKGALRDSGLYKSIRYTSIEDASKNHLHFQAHLSGTGYGDSQVLGMLSGYTLMTIPITVDYYFDLSVFHIKEGREVFSLGAAEQIDQTLWLPLIVLSPILNNYTTLNSVLSKQTRYLVSGIAAGKAPKLSRKANKTSETMSD